MLFSVNMERLLVKVSERIFFITDQEHPVATS